MSLPKFSKGSSTFGCNDLLQEDRLEDDQWDKSEQGAEQEGIAEHWWGCIWVLSFLGALSYKKRSQQAEASL